MNHNFIDDVILFKRYLFDNHIKGLMAQLDRERSFARFTKQEAKRILELKAQKTPIKEIAEELGRSYFAITSFLYNQKIKNPQPK